MKKNIGSVLALYFIIVCSLLLLLSACGNSEQPSANSTGTPPEQSGPAESIASAPPEAGAAKALVVYFSRSGSTRSVATEIQKQTNADIFEIIPEQPYTGDYNALLDIAKEEQRTKARPALSSTIDTFGNYDVIFLGYPIWWGDLPMILCTFLDSYDLSGKTIVPFCTSGGSGLAQSINSIKALEPDATVLDGLHLGSSSASDPGKAVTEWLSGLDVKL